MRLLTPVFMSMLLFSACAGDGDAECSAQTDCGATNAPCDGCAGEGDQLCLAGVCEEAGEVATSLNIGILRIEPRQLEVPSLTWAAADAVGPTGELSCSEVLSDSGVELNVLSAGFKNLSGGSQHTDVTVGRVPEGSVLLVLEGKDDSGGDGAVIATACEGPFDASGEQVDLELVTLSGE